jgi:hypothetical protein
VATLKELVILNNKWRKNAEIYKSLVLRFLGPMVFYTLRNMGYLVPFLKLPNLAKAQGQRTPNIKKNVLYKVTTQNF